VTFKPPEEDEFHPAAETNQVWAADITYIPIQGGFIYLCAVYRLV
jgi:transposase InsO family protein